MSRSGDHPQTDPIQPKPVDPVKLVDPKVLESVRVVRASLDKDWSEKMADARARVSKVSSKKLIF